MSDPFIAQIMPFGGNFAIRGWALCDGQLLPISQNSALFAIIGTFYGGDGRTTLGLPEMRGRMPIHMGTGPGLPNYPIGSRGGNYQTQLNTQNLPSHSHAITVKGAGGGTASSPVNNILAGSTVNMYAANDAAARNMGSNAASAANTGSGQAFNSMPPYIAVNYEIALVGVFPSRT